MTQKLAIRVGIGADGKTITRELMHEGLKVCDLSYLDTVEFLMQGASSLRDWTGKEQETLSWRR